MVQYHPKFTTQFPRKFASERIKRVCYMWWVHTPQGRRRVCFPRKLQGLIAIILRDYSVEHLEEAIKKYGKCVQNPETYYYGNSKYTLEYFLSGKSGEVLTKFTRDSIEEFSRAIKDEYHLEYK